MTRPIAFSLLCVLLGTAPAEVPPPDQYRSAALRSGGDGLRGKELFASPALACANCHSVDGSASKAGPDLSSAGDAFGRRDLVNSILSPSATIAPGYGTVIIETNSGETFAGTLQQKTGDRVELMGIDGKLVSVATPDIARQEGTPISLMPAGLHAAVSPQEFADLIEYLSTLKLPDSAVASTAGAPAEIPALAEPVAVRPFFSSEFTVERGRAETGLTSMRQVPGQPGEFLVLHQKGVIWRVKKTAEGEDRALFADLTSEVFSDRGPNGLLDVCFHPTFRESGKYYLFYQVYENDVVTTKIVERRFNRERTADSGEPGREIIRIASVAEDHSGGCLDFGADGFLYLVMGDTGPHHDPNGHAQNLQLLLGKVLRIDIDHQDPGLAYAIPQDNPFRDQDGARPEIWAYGLRNPWRFCFDRLTGKLWLADVGQDRVEEVNIIMRGGNYGWNVYEGFEPFSNAFREEARTYRTPVFAYGHRYGNSITGGHVYRGDKESSFYGTYICGDFNSKRLFAITEQDGELDKVRQIGTFPQRLVSFCEDEAGNHYAIGYEGMVYEIDFTTTQFE